MRLLPPKNPEEAIKSRRNSCYGFVFIADIQEHTKLVSFLKNTRDALLKIVDPDREEKLADPKRHPVRSPLYIKQSFFHASVFGMPPLVHKDDFVRLYANAH